MKQTSHAEFYTFWAWEYTKRNSDFVLCLESYLSHENYVIITNYLGGEDTKIPIGGCDISKFGFNEDFISCGIESEALLHALGEGTFTISVPGIRRLPRAVEVVRRFYGSDGKVKVHGEDEFSCKLLCKIDTKRKFKDIVGELKTVYDRMNIIDEIFFDEHGVPRGNGVNDGLDKMAQDALQTVRDYSESNDPYALKIKGVRITDMNQRAIGLWIWDKVKERYQGTPPHGALAGLVREMKDQFDLNNLGYAASETPTFRKLYNKTVQCIKACDVLPFS